MLDGLLIIQDQQELEEVHPMCPSLKFFDGPGLDEKVAIEVS